MQMYILDGKAFAALQESGQHNCETAVDECMLLANNQVIFAMPHNSIPRVKLILSGHFRVQPSIFGCLSDDYQTGGWPIPI